MLFSFLQAIDWNYEMVGLLLWVIVLGIVAHAKSQAGNMRFGRFLLTALSGALALGFTVPELGRLFGVQLPFVIPALLGAGLAGTWMICINRTKTH